MMGYMNPAYGRHMTGKISKVEAEYEEPARGKDHCEHCAHWLRPDLCVKVRGLISPEGWCKLFERAK
jgi:hypothetical protein